MLFLESHFRNPQKLVIKTDRWWWWSWKVNSLKVQCSSYSSPRSGMRDSFDFLHWKRLLFTRSKKSHLMSRKGFCKYLALRNIWIWKRALEISPVYNQRRRRLHAYWLYMMSFSIAKWLLLWQIFRTTTTRTTATDAFRQVTLKKKEISCHFPSVSCNTHGKETRRERGKNASFEELNFSYAAVFWDGNYFWGFW